MRNKVVFWRELSSWECYCWENMKACSILLQLSTSHSTFLLDMPGNRKIPKHFILSMTWHKVRNHYLLLSARSKVKYCLSLRRNSWTSFINWTILVCDVSCMKGKPDHQWLLFASQIEESANILANNTYYSHKNTKWNGQQGVKSLYP